MMGVHRQYFVIYTLLAIDQTGNQFTNNAHLGVQVTLETACTIVTYAAMLNVLFLAALTHAIKITQDKTKKCKMPQLWTQTAMFCCVHAVPAQVIIVLIIPVLNYESKVNTDEHGNLDLSHVEERKECWHGLAGDPLHHHGGAERRLHHWYCRRLRCTRA